MADNVNKPGNQESEKTEPRNEKTSESLSKDNSEVNSKDLRTALRANPDRRSTMSPDGESRFSLTDSDNDKVNEMKKASDQGQLMGAGGQFVQSEGDSIRDPYSFNWGDVPAQVSKAAEKCEQAVKDGKMSQSLGDYINHYHHEGNDPIADDLAKLVMSGAVLGDGTLLNQASVIAASNNDVMKVGLEKPPGDNLSAYEALITRAKQELSNQGFDVDHAQDFNDWLNAKAWLDGFLTVSG